MVCYPSTLCQSSYGNVWQRKAHIWLFKSHASGKVLILTYLREPRKIFVWSLRNLPWVRGFGLIFTLRPRLQVPSLLALHPSVTSAIPTFPGFLQPCSSWKYLRTFHLLRCYCFSAVELFMKLCYNPPPPIPRVRTSGCTKWYTKHRLCMCLDVASSAYPVLVSSFAIECC